MGAELCFDASFSIFSGRHFTTWLPYRLPRVFCIRSRQVEVLVSDLTQRGLRSQWPSAFRGLVSGNSCAWTCHIVEKWWRSNTHRQEMEGMSTFTCAYAVNLVAYNRN